MNSITSIFFKLSGREQTLLLFSIWTVVLFCSIKLLGSGFDKYKEWDKVGGLIEGHDQVLGQEPAINRELEEKRKEQKGVSYDLRALQNEVDLIRLKLFKGREQMARLRGGRKSEKNERYSQHNVEVTLSGVSWGDLTLFINEFFLDGREKYIFFSEVKITPNYRPNPEVYNATFDISSVEFRN
jgi:hypothetical protein